MKYKKIVLFFCVALPVSIIMRLLQLLFTIENETGFFLREYQKTGYYILVGIIAICAIMIFFSLTSHRNPNKPPRINIFLSITSFLLGLALLYDLSTQTFSSVVMQWQYLLYSLTGLCAAIYFIAISLTLFIKINIPPVLSVIPVIHYIFMIICSFTSISHLALITDNILIMAILCSVMFFMLNVAKLYNNIDTENNFRKLMASGFTSSLLCFTQSIPYFIYCGVLGNIYEHVSFSLNIYIFVLGIFIAAFTFSYFSINNVAKIRNHRHRDTSGQQLYT